MKSPPALTAGFVGYAAGNKMKYYTKEWWSSGCKDRTIGEKYYEYYKSIVSKLPAKLIDLEDNHTIHDANIKNIHSNFNNQIVSIYLRGWDRKLEKPVRYTLNFSGVKEFEQNLPQEEFVESELGDLGYWEFELIDNLIEMRMLFASDAEFKIIFRDFDFSFEAITA